ncbi:MAG: DUF421 domain-containing protein [Clostridia bacterium]|nr:DUF421 domain-containing protein [Clostridia bacterium]
MAAIFVRTVLIYLILIFTMRFSGKRQIGEMQISELVTTFLLSELASIPLTNPAIPFLHAVIPIFIIISAEIIFSFLTTKCAFAKKLLDGKPSIIIRRGKIQKKEMEHMRLSLDDLLCELRLKDIASLSEVDYAILEPNGKISVFSKNDTPLSHVLVVDGVLQKDILLDMKKSENWVVSFLKMHDIPDLKEIFLLSVADDDSYTLIKKGDCE